MRTQKRQSLGLKFAEKKFLKSKTINRNKNIFDIGVIDNYQTHQQKQRRTPYKTLHTSQIGQKLTQSFMNSTTVNSFKLESEIEKHKQKVGGSKINSRNNTRYIYYSDPEPTHKIIGIKGMSMDKMITRQYRASLNEQDQRSEDRFNNFYFGMPDDSRTRSFEKYISREELERLRLQTVPESNPEIPIIYEKLAYPSTTFKVTWDYKRNKEERGPVYFKVNKENSINLNEIRAENIQKGKHHTTAKWNKNLNNFLSLSSKQQKSQFERNFYSPNMDFRASKQKRPGTGKPLKIKAKKSFAEFERWELCDLKYFRIYHPSEIGKRLNTE